MTTTLSMTLKDLKQLELDLSAEKIRLLEEMNNRLYLNPDAMQTPEYKNLSSEYNDVTDRLQVVKEVIAERKSQMGRPSIGVGKVVKMTLPREDWAMIEDAISTGRAANYADYFRQLHQGQFVQEDSKWKSF